MHYVTQTRNTSSFKIHEALYCKNLISLFFRSFSRALKHFILNKINTLNQFSNFVKIIKIKGKKLWTNSPVGLHI